MSLPDVAHPSSLPLVERIYQAALEPALWPSVVGDIAFANESTKAVLLTPQHRPERGGIGFPVGIEQSAFQQWTDAYMERDMWSRALFARERAADGRVFLDEDLVPHERLVNSDWYRDFLSHIDVMRACLGVVFGPAAHDLPPTAVNVYRGASEPPFSVKHCRRLRALMPHLSRALGMMYRLREADLRIASNLAALDRLSAGVVLIGASGAVFHINRAAAEILERGEGLVLRESPSGRRLCARREDEQRLIEAQMAATVGTHDTPVRHFGSSVAVRRRSRRRALMLQFARLPECHTFNPAGGAVCGIVFITDPAREPRLDADALQRTYGITEGETRLAARIATGDTLQEAAEACGIALGTAKTHLARLFEKTGTRRQADLVRVLLSLASHGR